MAALPAPAPPRSPALKKSELLSTVDAKITEFRQEISASFDRRVNSVLDQIVELKASLPAPTNSAEDEAIKALVTKFEAQLQSTNSWKGDVEQAIVSLRSDVSTCVAAREARDARAVSPSSRPTTPTPLEHQAQAQDSPTFSDAPPIQTLASFSSPTSSRVGSPAPTFRNDSPALGSASTRRSPRKFALNSSLPALALPSHMVAHASPARSLRGRGSPAPTVQPESPSRPTISSIGKHARCSDASDLSVAIETVRSPPSAPTSVAVSASREGGHIRKRMRVSKGSIVDHEDDVAGDSSFASAEDGEAWFEERSQLLDEGASSFLEGGRDFIVQTKTGDEPSAHLSISAAPSTSDPSFFSFGAAPLLPHSPAPSGARKSLPMASLPFPIVSPFAAPRTSKSVHGTPASAARKQLFGQDLSNKRVPVPPTPPAAKTLYGSERVMFGDGDEDVLEGSRFEDVGEVSPRKPSWGAGLFGRA